jgi:hypothetical protein
VAVLAALPADVAAVTLQHHIPRRCEHDMTMIGTITLLTVQSLHLLGYACAWNTQQQNGVGVKTHITSWSNTVQLNSIGTYAYKGCLWAAAAAASLAQQHVPR